VLRHFQKICALLIGVAAMPSVAAAQESVAAFYRNRTINLIVGSSAGGGYDLYGRLVARYIGRHIPGNPAVVVSNMPGAGSIVLTQFIANVGPKDGTTIGAIFPGAIMEPLLGDKGKVKYDVTRLNYLGSANSDGYVCVARADAPVKRYADVFDTEIILGASSGGGSTVDFPTMMINLLGAKFRLVTGYPGSNEIALAIEKGEVQGTCGVGWSTITTGRPQWIRDGFARVLAQENLKAMPDIAALGAPLTLTFAKTDEQRQIMELVYAQPTFGRPYVVAPDVPSERVEALRAAFAATMADPELLAEAKRIHLDVVEPMPGAELQTLVQRLLSTPPDIVEKTKAAIKSR
jgi:tripartite-type tricarboxylate transporter receptor subunit TctC